MRLCHLEKILWAIASPEIDSRNICAHRPIHSATVNVTLSAPTSTVLTATRIDVPRTLPAFTVTSASVAPPVAIISLTSTHKAMSTGSSSTITSTSPDVRCISISPSSASPSPNALSGSFEDHPVQNDVQSASPPSDLLLTTDNFATPVTESISSVYQTLVLAYQGLIELFSLVLAGLGWVFAPDKWSHLHMALISCAAFSFGTYLSKPGHRWQMNFLLHDLCKSARTNNDVFWTLVIFPLYYLALPALPYNCNDPMNLLWVWLNNYNVEHSTMVLRALLWSMKWWQRHYQVPGHHILMAICVEIRPGVYRCRDVLRYFYRLGIDELNEKLPDILVDMIVAVIYIARFLKEILRFAYVAISQNLPWFVHLTISIIRFVLVSIRQILLGMLSTRLRERFEIIGWRIFIPTRLLRTRDLRERRREIGIDADLILHEYAAAANMSNEDIVNLMHLSQSQEIRFQDFNNGSVARLGRQAISYRTSLLKMITLINEQRRIMDAVLNYTFNRQNKVHNIRDVHASGEPYKSSKFMFLPEVNDQGFHFCIDPQTTSAIRSLDIFEFNRLTGRKQPPRNWTAEMLIKRSFLRAHCLDLFAKDEWAFDIVFPGIHKHLPLINPNDDIRDMHGLTPLPVEEHVREFGERIEDFAAQGELLQWDYQTSSRHDFHVAFPGGYAPLY